MLAPRPSAPGAPVPGWLGVALGLPAGAAAALVTAALPQTGRVGAAVRVGATPLVTGPSGGAVGSGPVGMGTVGMGTVGMGTVGMGTVIGIVLVVLVAALVGVVTEPLPALAAAAQVWACWDGFVRHGLGVLAFGPVDLAALGVVTAAALTTASVAVLRRHGVATLRGYAAGHLPAFLNSPVVD